MDSPMLFTRQKEITEYIKSNGFKLSEFDFKAIDNNQFELRWKKSNFYFIKEKHVQISPADKGILVNTHICNNWAAGLSYLTLWLKLLKKEVEIGNPWEEDENDFHFYSEINEEHEDGETHFTETEIKNISICLTEIKEYLLGNTALTQQQLNTIQSDIKRLEANSNKISAKDWYLLFIGQLFSWIAGGILAPDQPKILFHKLVESISSGMKIMFKISG